MVNLLVDNQKITAHRGQNLLSVCLKNDIYIPHLCFMEIEERPAASCRLCFVEIKGTSTPVPACTITVASGMQVTTDSPVVRRLQRSALRLLLSVHDVDCKNCHANRACELQKIARFLKVGLKPKPLAQIERSKGLDTRHPCIDHYPHRCVLCGKCIKICRSLHEMSIFSFAGRGIDAVIRHYPLSGWTESQCRDCSSCIDICPVGALKMREAESTSYDQERS